MKIVDVLPWHEPVTGDRGDNVGGGGENLSGGFRYCGRRHRVMDPAHLDGERVYHLAASGRHVADQGLR